MEVLNTNLTSFHSQVIISYTFRLESGLLFLGGGRESDPRLVFLKQHQFFQKYQQHVKQAQRSPKPHKDPDSEELG